MKVFFKLVLFMVFFQTLKAQDKPKRFEFGPTLLTINSFNKNYYSGADRQAIEISNGLFFKYFKNRYALRAILSYNECHLKYYAPIGCIDCTSGETNNKDLRIGIGFQYNITKKKEWLYTFADVSYRNVFSSGFVYGGFAGYNNSFASSTDGVDGVFGLGLKLKLFEDIFILPEFGYNTFLGNVHYNTTHLILGETKKYTYSQINANPIAKLHLTVRF